MVKIEYVDLDRCLNCGISLYGNNDNYHEENNRAYASKRVKQQKNKKSSKQTNPIEVDTNA